MAWQCFFLGRGESKHPSLPLARAERMPFDRKKKHPPRYQREKDFWFSFGTQKRTKPHRKSDLIRATSAHTRSKIKEKHLPFCRCSP